MIGWVALTLPSLFIVHKILGWAGLIVYLVISVVAVRSLPLLNVLSMRTLRVLAALAAGVVLLAFLIVFPRVDSNAPGQGSDDDDAHDVGVSALLHGESPYSQVTYLGNALHQLPGAFILAAPFTAIWTSALQNLFWVPMFFLAVRRVSGSLSHTVGSGLLILFFSPVVLHGVVTGTGHVSNAIYVTLGLWTLTWASHRWLAAVAFGIVLASRPNFLFLMPVAWGWLRHNHGVRAANTEMAIAGVTIATLVLPFFSLDSAAFGPLQAVDRLTRFDVIVPHAGQAIVACMTVASVGLALRPMGRVELFRNAALVQAIPVAIGLILGLMRNGEADMAFATYATFASWPWFMAEAAGPTSSNPVSASRSR